MRPADPPFSRPVRKRISAPSQVIKTVQLNPRMDMKPKFRYFDVSYESIRPVQTLLCLLMTDIP